MKSCATVAVAIVCAVGQSFRAAEQQPQPPAVQFETRADLILIDANVVDNDGGPIGDLTRDDFVVSIDGQQRPVASVQFVKSNPPAAAPPPKAAHYSSNVGVSDGRQILIVVDENSIPPGNARGVLMSADRFLKNLSPADRVAFIRLPRFEGSVDFTTDHQRVFEAVKNVSGKAHRAGLGRVTVAEAVAYERQDSFQWERAITRICGNLSGQERTLCVQEAENDASDKSTTYLQRARETVRGLAQIVDNVRHVPGPKTLVLLSQGFLSYDVRQDILRLADAAAVSRVSFYALYIDMPGMDMETHDSATTRLDDERLMAEGIDTLAGASRGTRFRIVGSADSIFTRVARELSAYYLLGVEPTDADRDGKPHRIKVEVKRQAVTVRARTQFIIEAASAAGDADAAPAGALLEVLRSATPVAGIPLRVTAFATPAASPDRVTLIVGADVGAPTTSPISGHIGLVVVDEDGKVVGNQFAAVTLRPDSGDEPSVPRFIGNVEIPSGTYTLRFAIVDSEGHSGSVHHPVDAKLKEAAGVSVSDLILMIPVRGLPARPEVHLNLDGEAVQATIQLAASNSPVLNETTVTFEIAEKPEGPPIVTVPAQMRNADGRAQPAAILDVGALAPGSYIARATVTIPGQKPVTRSRPFEIAPRRTVTATRTSAAAAAPVTAVIRSRVRPAIPPFKVEDVLAPAVVNPFIDHVLQNYSPSPAGREALNAIRTGNLRTPTTQRQIGDLALSFAQGLAMLAANKPAEADAYFRAALRSSSDFIGAAFYLGATLAATGRDRDAVAAWQTALISEVGAAGVYPVLIDGLLRLREGEQALDMLKEAEPTFGDRSAFKRRLVQAYAVMSRLDEALPLAHEYLAEHPTDLDMLFLTMQVIYEAHAGGGLANAAAELEKFREYAAKYEAAKGPQILIVQGWRKALAIR